MRHSPEFGACAQFVLFQVEEIIASEAVLVTCWTYTGTLFSPFCWLCKWLRWHLKYLWFAPGAVSADSCCCVGTPAYDCERVLEREGPSVSVVSFMLIWTKNVWGSLKQIITRWSLTERFFRWHAARELQDLRFDCMNEIFLDSSWILFFFFFVLCFVFSGHDTYVDLGKPV